MTPAFRRRLVKISIASSCSPVNLIDFFLTGCMFGLTGILYSKFLASGIWSSFFAKAFLRRRSRVVNFLARVDRSMRERANPRDFFYRAIFDERAGPPARFLFIARFLM